MLYTKENDSYVLNCVLNEGKVYKATESIWGEYFQPTTPQEIIDTYKFQCFANNITPFTDTLPTVTERDLRTVLPTELDKLIPKEEFLKLMKVFIHFADLKLEAGAMLIYSPTNGYKFIIGKHTKLSGAYCSTGGDNWPFVDLDGNTTTISDCIKDGYLIVGRFHSHHSMSPIPSGVDDKDEIGKGLLLCCITGRVQKDIFTGTHFWENRLTLASPFGRVLVKEESYIEPYDFFEIQDVYPEGIPQLIIDYISAGLPQVQPTYSYNWLPKTLPVPKKIETKQNFFLSSGVLDLLSRQALHDLRDAIDQKLKCESNYRL